jgi:hypothetical protein
MPIEVLKDQADHFELTDGADGSTSFSLTFDLNRDYSKLKRWWQRFTRS